MDLKYLIVLLLAACSLLSSVVSGFIKDRRYLFWKLSFYFSGYLFIPSLMKYFLGYQKENLIESFWNTRPATLIHYGVPMAVLAVAVPFILKFIFRETLLRVIRYFDSSLFFTLSFVFVLVRKINNRTYCVAFMLAFIITVAAVIMKRTNGEYCGRADIKNNITEMLPVLLYYMVTVVIYTPNELYLNNATDFPMSYWYFFGKLLAAGIIVTAVLLAGSILYLNQSHRKLYSALMFAFLTAGYIQGMFLNGSMEVLDGTANNVYNMSRICVNMGIWIAVTAAVTMFSIKKNDAARKFMKAVSIWITLIQIVSLGVLIISSKDTAPKSEMVLTTDGMLDIGDKNNVIVFILDKFDGSYIDEILEDAPDFFGPLNDFVSYENATSMFSPTYDSIPYLITGAEYEEGSSIDYVQYAYEDDDNNLLKVISDSGYDIGIYTNKRYVAECMKDIVPNYEEGVERTCSMSGLFSMMTQCSRYKMAPLAAKRYYIYDTSDIAQLVVNERIVNIENDLPFYHRLTEKGLRISKEDSEGTFRFIHMHGGHPPYTMTEDFQYIAYDYRRNDKWGDAVSQQKGAMKIVYEYMRQLRELGKYDDALIIITTDHGSTGNLSDSEGNMIEASYPILFVKQPYEHHEKMAISDAPVCHADVIATLRKKMGVSPSGRTLDDIGIEEERVRYMMVSTPDTFEKYEIDGDVSQIGNWRLLVRARKNLESTH